VDNRQANLARLASFRNYTHAKGMRWLGTLDSSCCTVCAALDGASWDLDGNPIDGNTISFQIPPHHDGCRCVLSILPKSLNELFGLEGLDETLGQTRAAAGGSVTGDTSMAGFLKRNPAIAREVLGIDRSELFLAGQVSLRCLISDTARLLSFEELSPKLEANSRTLRSGILNRLFGGFGRKH
jgi:hypothetical protein